MGGGKVKEGVALPWEAERLDALRTPVSRFCSCLAFPSSPVPDPVPLRCRLAGVFHSRGGTTTCVYLYSLYICIAVVFQRGLAVVFQRGQNRKRWCFSVA